MAAIANILEVLDRLDSAAVSVNQDRCVLVRNRNSACHRCAEACTSGCISFGENGLEVDASLCVGCGTCTTVCPTGALESKSPSDADMLGNCAKVHKKLSNEVVIVCSAKARRVSSSIDLEKCVLVPCLGRVDESLLITMACAGVEKIVLVHDACDACSYRPGKAVARDVAATTKELFEAWDIPCDIEIGELVPVECRQTEGSYDSGKRNALGSLLSQVKETTLDCMKNGDDCKTEKKLQFQRVTDDGTLPHFVPERRRQLLSVLAGRGEPQDVMVSTRLWGHVLIDNEKCSSCRMCATFCPTGAISKFEDDEGTIGIEHAPSICVKCRTCESICPEGALELSDDVFAVDLVEGVVERCPMKPRVEPKNQDEGVRSTMRSVLGIDRIY